MHNNQSSEDYLETILILSKQKPVVRSIDIVEELGYKTSSITLGVDPEVAAEDACQMEHVISQESFNAIKKHIVKVIE